MDPSSSANRSFARRSWVRRLLALPVLLALPGLLGVGIGGCAQWQKRRQLEAVAHDWSYTIRASQIVPVYPLSEDVQPGDVYLVQTPVDRQQEVYADRGFLPLDNLIDRLAPSGYGSFYARSFRLGGNGHELPKDLLQDGGAGWARAPTAAFPSYAFSVKSGQGAKVAVPVSGVPVGLSLMNADAAEGSITIADVRTYGVDSLSLHEDVRAWAAQPRAQEFLENFAPGDRPCWLFFRCRHENYVRVISRVYATRKVNVSLHDANSSSAEGHAGVPRTIDLITANASDDPKAATAANYAANVSALNGAITQAIEQADAVAPGGTLKVVSASSRSISLAETFAKPLVIGYLGFDMPVLEGGRLGAPIPTYALVSAQQDDAGDRPYESWDATDPTVACLNAWLGEGDREQQKRRVQTLGRWWRDEKNLEGFATLGIKTVARRAERREFMERENIACDE